MAGKVARISPKVRLCSNRFRALAAAGSRAVEMGRPWELRPHVYACVAGSTSEVQPKLAPKGAKDSQLLHLHLPRSLFSPFLRPLFFHGDTDEYSEPNGYG